MPVAKPTVITDAESLLVVEEGREHLAYLDTRKLWSNGIGHKFTDGLSHAGEVWSDTKIDTVFAADFNYARDGIAAHWPAIKRLDSVRQAYVVAMAFQMGIGGTLQFAHTLSCLAAGDWAGAAAGVRGSAWYGQTHDRAERCARAFLTGQWQQKP